MDDSLYNMPYNFGGEVAFDALVKNIENIKHMISDIHQDELHQSTISDDR